MNLFGKNIILWVFIGLLLIVLFNLFQGAGQQDKHEGIPYSDFVSSVESGSISDVTIKGPNISGH